MRWRKPRIGISSCLLGNAVRHDGGHKRNRYITDTLAQFFDFVAVCPELEVGMGVPREPVQLLGTPSAPRMIGQESGKDWTDAMQRFSRRRAVELKKLHLTGYILKANSPSCGIDRVRVYGGSGAANRTGRGWFDNHGYGAHEGEVRSRAADERCSLPHSRIGCRSDGG